MKLILAGTAGWIVARFVARRLRNGRLPPHTFVPKVIERNADSSTNTTVMDCKRSKLLHLGWRKSKIHLGAVTVIHALHSSICLSNKSIHVSPIDNCLAKFYNVSINKERHPRDLKINTGVSGQTHEESDMSNLAYPTPNAKFNRRPYSPAAALCSVVAPVDGVWKPYKVVNYVVNEDGERTELSAKEFYALITILRARGVTLVPFSLPLGHGLRVA